MPSRSKTQSLSVETVSEPRSESRRSREKEYREEREEKGEMEERSEKSEKKGGCGWGLWGRDKDGKRRGWGYASMWIWFILVPVVIWIILFSVRPNFVTDTVNGTAVINQQKLLLWSLIGSVAGWIIVYAAYYLKY